MIVIGFYVIIFIQLVSNGKSWLIKSLEEITNRFLVKFLHLIKNSHLLDTENTCGGICSNKIAISR